MKSSEVPRRPSRLRDRWKRNFPCWGFWNKRLLCQTNIGPWVHVRCSAWSWRFFTRFSKPKQVMRYYCLSYYSEMLKNFIIRILLSRTQSIFQKIQILALHMHSCWSLQRQRKLTVLSRQGTQQQRPESPTPPGMRVNTKYILKKRMPPVAYIPSISLLLCPLSAERYYLPSFVDSTQAL